jgi:hypothetical protein
MVSVTWSDDPAASSGPRFSVATYTTLLLGRIESQLKADPRHDHGMQSRARTSTAGLPAPRRVVITIGAEPPMASWPRIVPPKAPTNETLRAALGMRCSQTCCIALVGAIRRRRSPATRVLAGEQPDRRQS